jgi:DNA-binding response OmpR family regulator
MRLLVVEDNTRLAKYVSVACRAKGFVVDLAHSLAEAQGAIAGMRYETIVLDLGLPDGDGLRGCKKSGAPDCTRPSSSSRHETPREQWWKDWTLALTTI